MPMSPLPRSIPSSSPLFLQDAITAVAAAVPPNRVKNLRRCMPRVTTSLSCSTGMSCLVFSITEVLMKGYLTTYEVFSQKDFSIENIKHNALDKKHCFVQHLII